jgi:signal transduction histidine kinase
MMKSQLLVLSRRYQAALQKHLQPGPKPRGQPAHQLGERAVTLGLETLDLARIHKTALGGLIAGESSAAKDRMARRAGIFFTEALEPIEKTHRAGVESAAHLKRQKKTLRRRTAQLAVANRRLRHGIARRKAAEGTLKAREQHFAKWLEESRRLQKHLQCLTHRALSAQENEKRQLSHDLHDEIAQTLLAINVRLLTLRKGAAARGEGLAKEIASTQKLVQKSVKIINCFARKFDVRHEA